ncbi:hypothetical protein [Kitasatospora sp. NPDC051914]|uniref:hypothetical protein n=1 Tax=Kitasatospora sp. NPDC051914 TaxID=3154945 RepID=UPI00343FB063
MDDWRVTGLYRQLVTDDPAYPANSGVWKAKLGGSGATYRLGHRISQDITVPALRVPAVTFHMKADYIGIQHRLVVTAVTADGTRTDLYTRHNAAGGSGGYEPVTVTFPDKFYSSSNQTVTLEFTHWDEAGNTAPFLLDDVSMQYRYKSARLPLYDFTKYPLTSAVR